MSKHLLTKLERYEEEAYEGGYGSDWLEQVGEGFKFYIQECVTSGRRATITGFERYLDALHKQASETGE